MLCGIAIAVALAVALAVAVAVAVNNYLRFGDFPKAHESM